MIDLLFVAHALPVVQTAEAPAPKVWVGATFRWRDFPQTHRYMDYDRLRAGVRYGVNLSCTVGRSGRLTACKVTRVFPDDAPAEMPRAMLRAAGAARIIEAPDGPQPGDELQFALTVEVEDVEP